MSHYRFSRRALLGQAGGCLLTVAAGPGRAQPAAPPPGPSLLERGSNVMRVEHFDLPAPGGQGAGYRIGLLTPRLAPPVAGFPMLCLLDGQAVLADLDEALLRAAMGLQPRVIVTLGYDSAARFAARERSRDYTPPDAQGAPAPDPLGRPGGGAANFLALLEGQILPQVAQAAPVDGARVTLWGHSYGGLFALYAASRAASPFARVVSASPALWWQSGAYLARLEAQVTAGDWPRRRLDLHRGTREDAPRPMPADPGARAMLEMRAALPPAALARLDALLRARGVPGALTRFAGLDHGASFTASWRHLLLEAA